MLTANLISDLENAIATRSHETGTMLRGITDLFLANAGSYSADQLDVYDSVLKLLIANVEVTARAELAKRLAPIGHAPANTIRSLALDTAIEVAEPALSQSNALDDDTLILCTTIHGQQHLLAIATRRKLSEMVSNHIITKGGNDVLRTIASNPGAAISDPSFAILVKKSTADDCLLETVAKRIDVPEHHLRELVSKASEVVRQRLMAAAPALHDIIQEVIPKGMPVVADDELAACQDYRTAELVVESRPVTESVIVEFAKAKRLEEIVVSISKLSGLPTREIERLFLGAWSSPVAVILKAIGFHLATMDAIYHTRLSNGEVARNDLSAIKSEFISLRRATAERILRFYCARKAVEPSRFS